MRNGWYDEFGRLIHYVNDKFHNEKCPTEICYDGSKYWCQNDQHHRIDGPACEYSDGTKHWFHRGKQIKCKYQQEFEIKIIMVKNNKKLLNGWQENKYGFLNHYVNGKKHNQIAPAEVWQNGSKFWYQNYKSHRIDGPAFEFHDGCKCWCFHGAETNCKSQIEFIRCLKLKLLW